MQALYQSPLTGIIFLLVLFAGVTNCEANKKQEIGDKLAEAIEIHAGELFDSNIAVLKDLLEKLLKTGKPTPAQAEVLRNHILDLDNLCSSKAEMPAAKLIEAVVRRIQEKLIDIFLSPVEEVYEADDVAIQAIRESLSKSEEINRKFAMVIYKTWAELFKTLTKDDLAEHAEYGRINELMEGIERSGGKGAVFIDAIKEVAFFFEYKNWDFFLSLRN